MQGDGQSGDVGQRIQIRGSVAVSAPEPLLTDRLEAGVVALTLRTQGISPFEIEVLCLLPEQCVSQCFHFRYIYGLDCRFDRNDRINLPDGL